MADGKVVIDVTLNDGKVARGVANVDGRLRGLGKSANASSLTVGKLVGALGAIGLASKGIDMVTQAIDGAISRYDTLNNFPRVMQQLGFDAQTSEKAINKLSDGIQGLPTTLDSVASTAQRIAVLTGDLDGAVDTTLALNNAFLASGSSAADAERGLTQYLQMLAKGKVDMDAWNTLQETMGVALNDTAKAFGFTGKSAQMDLYEALQQGHITFDEFNAKLIELNNAQGGFAERAKTATGGIRTAWTNMQTAVVRGVADIIGAIDQALGGTGSIEKIIGRMQKGITSAFSAMVEYIPIVFGAIKTIYDVLEPFIPLVVGLVAAIATFQTTIAIINSVKNAFMAARLAVIAFNTSLLANPFVAIAAAVVGIAVLIYMYWDEISAFLSSTWEWIKETASAIFGPIAEFITGVWDSIKSTTIAVWNGIKDFLAEWGTTLLAILLPGIGLVVAMIIENWDVVKAVTIAVWNAIKAFFAPVINGIVNVVQSGWNLIKTVTTTVWSAIKSVISAVWSAIKPIVSPVINWIISTVKTSWNTIKSVTTSVFNSVKSVVTTVWNGIKSGIGKSISGITQAVKDGFRLVRSIIRLDLGSARDIVMSYVSRFRSSGKALLDALAKGIRQGLSAAINAVSSGMKKIRSYLPFSPAKVGPLSDLDKSGESFFPTWADGMEKGERKLVRQVEIGMGRVSQMLSASLLSIPQPTSAVAAGISPIAEEPAPVIVQNMTIREEADIHRVADELWRLQQRRDRRRIRG